MSSPPYFLAFCFGADLLNQEAQHRNVHFMLENHHVYNSMMQPFHILAKTGPCQAYSLEYIIMKSSAVQISRGTRLLLHQ